VCSTSDKILVVTSASPDPTVVLAGALDAAISDFPAGATQDVAAAVNRMLEAFGNAMAPVQDRLRELAAAEPDGAVSLCLALLQRVFSALADNDKLDQARADLISARMLLFRVVLPDDGPDGADEARRWSI
jgi:hypothetical protein